MNEEIKHLKNNLRKHCTVGKPAHRTAHRLWKFCQHSFVSFYLLLACDDLIFVFSRNVAWQYTAEEACEAIMNDDSFGKLESANSLDESFTDSKSSCSEVDSISDKNYCGWTIATETPTPSPARQRPRARKRVETMEPMELHIIYLQTNDFLLQYLMMKLIHQKIQVQALKLMSLSLIFGRTIHQLWRTSHSINRLD